MTRAYHGELECKSCGHYEAVHYENEFGCLADDSPGHICGCIKFTPPDPIEYTIEKDGKITYIVPDTSATAYTKKQLKEIIAKERAEAFEEGKKANESPCMVRGPHYCKFGGYVVHP